MSNNYLYHYYPIRESETLNEIGHGETIDTLFKKQKLVDIERKKLLYPYRDLYDLNYLLGLKKIWLNKSQDQNDPFELDGYYERDFLAKQGYEFYTNSPNFKKHPMTQEEWNKGFPPDSLIRWDNYLPKIKLYHGMYSFSLSEDSILMWSYYATGHQGVCIRFKVSDELAQIISEATRTIKLIKYNDHVSGNHSALLLGKIEYPSIDANNPLIIDHDIYLHYKDYYKNLITGFSKGNPDNYFTNEKNFTEYDLLSVIFILNKAYEWQHEKEFRLFLLSEQMTGPWKEGIPIADLISTDTGKPFFEVDSIIFGCRTSPLIKNIVMKSFKDNYQYYEANKLPGAYKLNIKKLARQF
jgi:hypothetical protein